MSKTFVTAPVLALAATAAPAYASPVYEWTGFYIGAHGAYVDPSAKWDGNNVYQTVVDGGEGSLTLVPHNDVIAEKLSHGTVGGGAKAGFNFQTGSVVLGAEADVTFFSFDRMATWTGPAASYTLASHASNLETLRAKAGVTFGQVMLYGTGGLAYSNLKHSIMATDHSQVIIVDGGEGGGSSIGAQTANLSDAAHNHFGWTIGGGVEAMVGDNISVQLNLLDVMFDHRNLSDQSGVSKISATVDTHMLVGTLGINYRF